MDTLLDTLNEGRLSFLEISMFLKMLICSTPTISSNRKWESSPQPSRIRSKRVQIFLKLSSNEFYRKCVYIITYWNPVFCQTYHSTAAHLLPRDFLEDAEILDPVFAD